MSEFKRPKRSPVATLLAGLNSDNKAESIQAGQHLVSQARSSGLSMKDYLILAADTSGEKKFDGLNGFEATLMHLELPFKNAFDSGIMLQAASDTFQVYAGTRALFPEVVDEMLRWKTRMPTLENVEDLVSQSRTITGTELITTVLDDSDANGGNDNRRTSVIAELAQIPMRTLRSSQTSVSFHKHGSGYNLSYEFDRRAGLDVLTPYAARVAREAQISRVKYATAIMVNGDGVNPAAPIVPISAVGGAAGTLTYKAITTWLIKQAEKGVVFDTIMGNVDMYIALSNLFTPVVGQSSEAEVLSGRNMPAVTLPILAGAVKFVLSSSMPAGKIMGFTKSETLEELIEANSLINESERSVINQSISYIRTMNAGYKLSFGDTRSILNVAA